MNKILAALDDCTDTHEPNRLAFVGKNAATWFYRYIEGKPTTHSQASGHKNDRRSLQGLELDWDNKGLDYFVLSNTHRHWDREVWVEFWDRCRDDVSRIQS